MCKALKRFGTKKSAFRQFEIDSINSSQEYKMGFIIAVVVIGIIAAILWVLSVGWNDHEGGN